MTEPAHWLTLAAEDLTMAQYAADAGMHRQTCFHSQEEVDLLAGEPTAEEARASITDAKALVSRMRDLIGAAS